MDMTMLKAHLGEELYARVEEKLGDLDGFQVIASHDGTWLPKSRLDAEIARRRELQAVVDGLKGELEEARERLEEGGKLRQKAEHLEGELADREKTIAALRRSGRIREALAQADARDIAVVERLLDESRIGEDDSGNLTGVEEQIRALKEKSGYLFNDTRPAAQRAGYGGGKAPGTGGASRYRDVNAAIRTAAGRR